MARYLEQCATWVGEGSAPGRLYDLGRFPGMIEPDRSEQRVIGDVYQLQDVGTLEELDRYENDGSSSTMLYERSVTHVTLADGRRIEAWIYWYRGAVEESRHIESGDYFTRPI